MAQRLRERVEATRFSAASPSTIVRLTISIGLASFPHDADSKSELLKAADAALYESKRAGRNQVVLYSELYTNRERRQEKRLSIALPVVRFPGRIRLPNCLSKTQLQLISPRRAPGYGQ